ncbi:MAG: alpha/beta hydrolase [Myxococcota bacterium]
MVDWRLRLAAWVTERLSTPPWKTTPAEARAQLRASVRRARWLTGKPPAVALVRDEAVAGVPVRRYRPVDSTEALPGVVYFHGGGWVQGDLETHDGVCRALCLASGASVVAVDYRLAPEHPYPAAHEDARAVVRALQRNGGAFGLDGARLAVAGDSAGGNLAAAVALSLKGLRAQVLVYPVLDCVDESASYATFATGHFLTREDMRFFIRSYLPREEDRHGLDASPLRHPGALAGAPPAFVLTAEADVLRDEGQAYTRALEAAGVEVESDAGRGMLHGFFNLQALGEARRTMRRAGEWLRRKLA